MITLRVPAVIDEGVLKLALEVAQKTGTSVQLETFYRIRLSGVDCLIDCDTQKEAMDFVLNTTKTPKSATQVDAVVPGAGVTTE